MRTSLSKDDRKEISETVIQLVSEYLRSQEFEPCSGKNLWSKDFDGYTGFIRFKQILNFSEWPTFQLNFGLNPQFSIEIQYIIKDFLRIKRPMYEEWSYDSKALEADHKRKYKGVYSAIYPGTWEFRTPKEVAHKVDKINQFISDYYSSFLETRLSDEYIANVSFRAVNELPASFRVLQIISLGNLKRIDRIEALLSYYRDSNFGPSGSRFTKFIEKYGNELLAHFR